MVGYLEFLRGLFENPRGVRAPTPSSAFLSAAMADEVDLERPGLVIELGAGTGVVTEALLNRGIAAERLLVIESTPAFVKLLRQRFPDVRVVQGDALRFDQHVPPGSAVASVVSGLPLLSFPAALRSVLIDRALVLQGDGGRFVQLSYGWRPAVPGDSVLRVTRRFVWRNVPPAFVWTYTKAPAAARSQRTRIDHFPALTGP
jgi:phosphatidylethanolamine/phosphatidyl-N-methylethanolamine N-methyltransferase